MAFSPWYSARTSPTCWGCYRWFKNLILYVRYLMVSWHISWLDHCGYFKGSPVSEELFWINFLWRTSSSCASWPLWKLRSLWMETVKDGRLLQKCIFLLDNWLLIYTQPQRARSMFIYCLLIILTPKHRGKINALLTINPNLIISLLDTRRSLFIH